MKKFKRSKKQRKDEKSLLFSTELAFPVDGLDEAEVEYVSPCIQNTVNNQRELSFQGGSGKGQVALSALADILGVGPEAIPEEPEATLNQGWDSLKAWKEDPENLQQKFQLIEASVDKNFPKLSAEGAVELEIVLAEVQNTVLKELLRQAPLLEEAQLLECLIDCYHRRTFEYLNSVLLHISKTRQAFALLDWILQTYLSPEYLGHPGLKGNALKTVDLLPLADLVQQAESKLLINVREEVSRSLRGILQNESDREAGVSGNAEAFISLHLDVIQCIDAMQKRAREISPTLMCRVQIVCFQELQNFVHRYICIEKKHLQKHHKMDKSSLMHCFKAFNDCRELKQYVQMTGKDTKSHVYTETCSVLENMEAFALKLFLETLTHFTEVSLKSYFKSDDEKIYCMRTEIVELFHPLPKHLETQTIVMNEAYKKITSLYFQFLVGSKSQRLRKRWPDIGKTVIRDAELLHSLFKSLNPRVEPWNLILLKVKEVLECSDVNILKLIIAVTLRDCSIASVDYMKTLLCWKGGLSSSQIREVLETSQAVIFSSESQRRPRLCCLICC